MSAKPLPEREELHRVFSVDWEAGVLFWRWRADVSLNINRKMAGRVAGRLLNSGHMCVQIGGEVFRVHAILWLLYGLDPVPEGYEIDHRDGDPGNNHWRNLRLATHAQNNANCALRRDSSSGVKGVHLRKDTGKFAAQICVNGRIKHLGCFDDINDAAQAYWTAAQKYFGKFARAA